MSKKIVLSKKVTLVEDEKVDRAKTDMQVNDIANMIAEGVPKHKIKEHFMNKWEKGDMGFNKLYIVARKLLNDEAREHRVEELGKTLRRLYKIHDLAIQNEQYNVALGVNNTIIGMLRLNELIIDDSEEKNKFKIQVILDKGNEV